MDRQSERSVADGPVVLDYAIPVPVDTQFEGVHMGRDTMTYGDGPVQSDDD